jgi:hypothetical protein
MQGGASPIGRPPDGHLFGHRADLAEDSFLLAGEEREATGISDVAS